MFRKTALRLGALALVVGLVAPLADAQRNLTILGIPYGPLGASDVTLDPDTAPIRIDIDVFNHVSWASLTRLTVDGRDLMTTLQCNCFTEDLFIVFQGQEGIWIPTLEKEYDPILCDKPTTYDRLPEACPSVVITQVKPLSFPDDQARRLPWRPNLKLDGKVYFFEALLVFIYPGKQPVWTPFIGRVEECDGPCR